MRIFVIAAASLLAACQPGSPAIAVGDAWARSTVPGQTSSAAYLSIENGGTGPDRLLTVSMAGADAFLHSSSNEDGIARMRPLTDGIEVPAGGRVALAPGGDHIMLMGLEQPLRPGDRLELRLRFEHSGERRAMVRIVDAAAAAPTHTGHSGDQ